MNLWECMHYQIDKNNNPYCERKMCLEQCSSDCKHNYTWGQWRELVKKMPYKGVRVNAEKNKI